MKTSNLNDLRIFLCHTSKDKAFVRKLANDLFTLDVIPWLDEWDLEPGDSLHGRIGDALEQCSFVGVVLSPDSVTSPWVQKELRQALCREDRTGRKVVIPLLHRSVRLPPFLEDKLYIDFEKSYWAALGRLAGFVHHLNARKLATELASVTPKSMVTLTEVLTRIGWKATAITDSVTYRAVQRLFKLYGYRNVEPDIFRIYAEFLGKQQSPFRTIRPIALR
jgi:hypothetical protein